jgi:hypothetical protein
MWRVFRQLFVRSIEKHRSGAGPADVMVGIAMLSPGSKDSYGMYFMAE